SKAISTRILILACGGLSRPANPNIPSLNQFQGDIFHSARWRHDLDLSTHHVGVIGTGASAIQFIPHLQKNSKSLTIFQRTPPWILPRLDRPISKLEQTIFKRFPLTQWLYRQLIYWRLETRVIPFTILPQTMKIPQQLALNYLR